MTHIPDAAVQAALEYYSEGGCMGLDSYDRKEVATAMIEAALPHLSTPCSVEVKKLEWERSVKGIWIGSPNPDLGNLTYWIFEENGWYSYISNGRKTLFPTLEEAKSAAQADFERRVRECVVTKPVDVAAVRRQAFEEAVLVAETKPMRFAGQTEKTVRETIASAIRALSAAPNSEAEA